MFPQPNTHSDIIVKDATGAVVDLAHVVFNQGVVVGDGSASRIAIPQLNRAAFALAWLRAEDLALIYTVQGAVPACFPQTSQAAENLAPTQASDLAKDEWTYFGDCWNVIEMMGKPLHHQLRHSKMYAGVRRFAKAQFGDSGFMTAVHQKAHLSDLDIAALADKDLITLALENRRVDLLAKQALTLCHPQPTKQQTDEAELLMKRQREVCQTIQFVLPSSTRAQVCPPPPGCQAFQGRTSSGQSCAGYAEATSQGGCSPSPLAPMCGLC